MFFRERELKGELASKEGEEIENIEVWLQSKTYSISFSDVLIEREKAYDPR